MKEVWKDIKGYEGKYQISSLGRVKSLKYNNTKESKLLHQSLINNYYSVCLWKQRKWKQYRIHRLVAQTFIPNPDNLPEVNHKDENKLNNAASNLEWCTHIDNINHGARNSRVSKTKTNNTYNTKPVICIETGVIYPSTREAERQTGIDNSQISAVCRHKKNYKTAGGYHWEYIKQKGVIKNENN